MKLHAIVLAAGQSVPIYALEYRPKCRDFMKSLGTDDDCVRLDQLDMNHLSAWVIDALKRPRIDTGALTAARRRLADAFVLEADRIAQL